MALPIVPNGIIPVDQKPGEQFQTGNQGAAKDQLREEGQLLAAAVNCADAKETQTAQKEHAAVAAPAP